jgi:hypothetical protein
MRRFLMNDGHIAAVEPEALQGLSDEEALARARMLFEARKDKFDGFEVWEGARVVIQEPPLKGGFLVGRAANWRKAIKIFERAELLPWTIDLTELRALFQGVRIEFGDEVRLKRYGAHRKDPD